MARILVVDDEADMRMALANVLSRMGHRVFEAGDGPSALEFLSSEGAELVLLDMRLPGMDGLQILRTLRETDRKTPVIMVTGYGSVESAVEVMQLGAAHYLAKPFSNQELVDTVERVLRGGTLPERVGVLGRRLAEKVRGGLAPLEARAPVIAAGGSVVAARPEHSVWPWLAGLAALFMAIALLWFAAGRRPGRDFGIPHEHPTALVWVGDRLFSSDWYTQSIYEFRLRGGRLEAVRSVRLPGTHITGMAFADGHLYVCDSQKRAIQKRRVDKQLSLVRAYTSPGPNPAGLFWDGKYLWSSDASTDRFYRHVVTADLAVVASYRAPGKNPASIYKDDAYFWSADSETRLIYRHRLDGKLRVLSVFSSQLLDQGPAPLSAFTLRGDNIWLGRDGSATLHVRPISKFERLAARELK
ncbi:response regulator [Elusimicrobiota bacterium]